MRRFLFDTMVFVYAVGEEHPLREPCRQLVAAAGGGALNGHASVVLMLEFAHQRARRTGDRAAAYRLAGQLRGLCRTLDATPDDLDRALLLGARHERLDATDALFAATALNRGIELVLSSDRGFDDVDGLSRVDPGDPAALDRLTGAAG